MLLCCYYTCEVCCASGLSEDHPSSFVHVLLVTLLLISFGLLLLPLPFTLFNALIGVNIIDHPPIRVINPAGLRVQPNGGAKLAGYASTGGTLERLLLNKCEVCKTGIRLIQLLISLNRSEAEITDGVRSFCIKLQLEDKRVCAGLVNEFKVN